MPPILVVILYPASDAAARFAPGFVGMQVNILVLQAAPKPFHHDVIAPAGLVPGVFLTADDFIRPSAEPRAFAVQYMLVATW